MANRNLLIPELSLSTQAIMENDRREAVKMNLQDLQILADKLICDWYQHQAMINCYLTAIGRLEVEKMLAECSPSSTTPSPEHFQWAQELLGPETTPAAPRHQLWGEGVAALAVAVAVLAVVILRLAM